MILGCVCSVRTVLRIMSVTVSIEKRWHLCVAMFSHFHLAKFLDTVQGLIQLKFSICVLIVDKGKVRQLQQ